MWKQIITHIPKSHYPPLAELPHWVPTTLVTLRRVGRATQTTLISALPLKIFQCALMWLVHWQMRFVGLYHLHHGALWQHSTIRLVAISISWWSRTVLRAVLGKRFPKSVGGGGHRVHSLYTAINPNWISSIFAIKVTGQNLSVERQADCNPAWKTSKSDQDFLNELAN